MTTIKSLAASLPTSPGIYKMLDKDGIVIYIGKAKNLRDRVKTYFQKDYEHSTRTKKLIENAADIKFIETGSELEALILETNLIKELRPRYNILMKDDKSYVYIKIDLNEDFPKIRLVREREIETERKNSASRESHVKYFGPKLPSARVFDILRTLKKLFPFRHCNLNIEFLGDKKNSENSFQNLQISPNNKPVHVTNKVIDFPCMDYFIKRCPGPCIGAISPIEYKKIVQQIINFLNGKNDELENYLKQEMAIAAEKKLFEKAARLRDKLFAIKDITEKQIITDPRRTNTDVINFTADASLLLGKTGHLYFNILMIRNGKLINQENFMLDAYEMGQSDLPIDLKETLEAFITQYYEKAIDIPKEILIPENIENIETFEKWLTKIKNENVSILIPERGIKNQLLELSLKNAVSFARQYRIKWLADERGETALARLAEVLKMKIEEGGKNPLKRIEGFDISHLGGENTVGSMVVFENGKAKSDLYRHFKMRTVSEKPDDYRCMEEALMRRLKYLTNSNDINFQFKTPTKDDLIEIEKIIKKEKTDTPAFKLEKKDFLCVKKDKKIIGFGRILKLDTNVSIIASLWVSSSERGNGLGYKIMKKLISRAKLKRVYIKTNKKPEDYFAVFGFTVLHKEPDALRQIKISTKKIDAISMVYDATKHKTDASFAAKPDLIVIDGGKGQLSTAISVLKKLKMDLPVIALAKRLEEIYLPGEKAPILLEEGDEALKLLQRIRDESHRFAITFQRDLQRKGLIR